MNNFEFRNPTKIIFGKGEIASLSKLVAKGTNVLITYGGGSIKRNGVYDQVMNALSGCNVTEFGGIEANPDYNTLVKAIAVSKETKTDLILAVGGGSVIDGTKFIAAGANYDGDPWDFITGKADVPEALPFGTVLTLPATASEMNNGAVISRRSTNEKLAFFNETGYPKFSILDPTVIYSLPKKQIANGITDTYIHTVEQYLTTTNSPRIMDRFAEGILKTLIEISPDLISGELKYEDCADFMLTATMGLNGFISMGVDEDWATHMIGHELTALHGLDHAETLAVVYPGTISVMRNEKKAKLLQYAERVFGIKEADDNVAITIAINKTEEFFRSLGIKTRLFEYGIGGDTVNIIVQRFKDRKWSLGEHGIVTPDKVKEILSERL